MKKSLFERAVNIRGGALESRLVARSDDMNRDLTDSETLAECQYILETIDYAGREPETVREIKQACRYIIRAYKGY